MSSDIGRDIVPALTIQVKFASAAPNNWSRIVVITAVMTAVITAVITAVVVVLWAIKYELQILNN